MERHFGCSPGQRHRPFLAPTPMQLGQRGLRQPFLLQLSLPRLPKEQEADVFSAHSLGVDSKHRPPHPPTPELWGPEAPAEHPPCLLLWSHGPRWARGSGTLGPRRMLSAPLRKWGCGRRMCIMCSVYACECADVCYICVFV